MPVEVIIVDVASPATVSEICDKMMGLDPKIPIIIMSDGIESQSLESSCLFTNAVFIVPRWLKWAALRPLVTSVYTIKHIDMPALGAVK